MVINTSKTRRNTIDITAKSKCKQLPLVACSGIPVADQREQCVAITYKVNAKTQIDANFRVILLA